MRLFPIVSTAQSLSLVWNCTPSLEKYNQNLKDGNADDFCRGTDNILQTSVKMKAWLSLTLLPVIVDMYLNAATKANIMAVIDR